MPVCLAWRPASGVFAGLSVPPFGGALALARFALGAPGHGIVCGPGAGSGPRPKDSLSLYAHLEKAK